MAYVQGLYVWRIKNSIFTNMSRGIIAITRIHVSNKLKKYSFKNNMQSEQINKH